jgi:hypothetical protein
MIIDTSKRIQIVIPAMPVDRQASRSEAKSQAEIQDITDRVRGLTLDSRFSRNDKPTTTFD